MDWVHACTAALEIRNYSPAQRSRPPLNVLKHTHIHGIPGEPTLNRQEKFCNRHREIRSRFRSGNFTMQRRPATIDCFTFRIVDGLTEPDKSL